MKEGDSVVVTFDNHPIFRKGTVGKYLYKNLDGAMIEFSKDVTYEGAYWVADTHFELLEDDTLTITCTAGPIMSIPHEWSVALVKRGWVRWEGHAWTKDGSTSVHNWWDIVTAILMQGL